MRLLLADGAELELTERPGRGPWTFLVVGPDLGPDLGPEGGQELGELLAGFGRVGVPGLAGRLDAAAMADQAALLALADDLDQVRTQAGLGKPVLVGEGAAAPVALRAATDQPWAWRGVVLLSPPAETGAGAGAPEAPVLVAADRADLAARLADWLEGLGGPPAWSGVAADAPPR